MSFMSRLRIGRRLSLAFGVIVALTLATAAFSQWRLSEVRTLAGELILEQSERLALSYHWRQNIAINSVRVTMMGMLTDQALSMALADKIKVTSADTSTVQQRFEALETTPGGRTLQKELSEARKRYLASRELMMKAGEGGTSIAAAIAKGQAIKAFSAVAEEYLGVADKMVSFEQHRGESDGAAIEAAVQVTSLVGLVCAAVCALGSILMGVLITRSIVGPVRAAQQAADRIAAGDLTGTCAIEGTDETAQLATSLHIMQESLKRIVREIRSATESIQVGSTEVASGNQDLSVRTEQTAGSLQQAASSMEELNTTLHHSAQAAGQANGLAITASEIALRGGSVVAQVVQTMDEINTSSKRIGDIIGVIDGIAFQTNILALNAAVEAARAGEQGRGFAVVASEVRALAQRSAGAAREIKALIGASVGKVANGARLVQDAGTTMEEIVAAVRRVSDVIGEITTAAGEQAGGIQLVNDAVNNVDQMTQQNAALVEQSAAAAESMRDQASRLAHAVEQFRTH